MSKIKCVVVDDEPIAREYLSDYIKKMPQLELLAVYSKALDAYEKIESGEADLVFLDIQMPGMTGIDFIRTLQRKPAVILTTAYSEYALQGYELDVTDYLLKPIPFERFAKAVNKVIALIASRGGKNKFALAEPVSDPPSSRDFIFVRSGYKSVKVNVPDILYVEGMKEYVVFYTKEKKYTKLDRMRNIENQLRNQGFIRIHKSYIVSVKNINAVFGNIVEVNGVELPVGRSYKEKVSIILGMRE